MEDRPLASRPASLADITRLIRTLRGENGCPWDRKQTPRSIAVYLIEEVFELVEAIESGNDAEVLEELGDVVFQVLFVAELFREDGRFGIPEVVAHNLEKMRRRHPHVFEGREVAGVDDIRANWHAIKQQEKKATDEGSVLDSVPTGLPALMRAYRVSERAARTGFDWENLAEVMGKVNEEWEEFGAVAADGGGPERTAAEVEFGDILFTLVNVARFAGIHPESALSAAVRKFDERFRHMESLARREGRPVEALSREELDRRWEAAKRAVDGG